MKNLLFVVAHRQFQIPQKVFSSPYRIVLVGDKAKEDPFWQQSGLHVWYDCDGVNISEKNSHYCELTAHYYVWKNKADEYDHIGLCHYRRYFTKNRFSNDPKYFLTDEDIDKFLSKYDIILPIKVHWNKKLMAFLGYEGLQEIFEKSFPEYLSEFEKIKRKNAASFYNMFIMKTDLFKEYSEWVFQFFTEWEKVKPMTDKNKRGYGYLSEYLLNIWVQTRKLKIKYVPVAYADAPKKYQLDWGVRSIFHLNGYNLHEKFGIKSKQKAKNIKTK